MNTPTFAGRAASRRLLRVAAIMVLLSVLTACTARPGYVDTARPLDVQQFFDGELKAWGLVRDWRGRVVRRFEADISASWDGDEGVLDEWFVFDDGERQPRVWRLRMTGERGHFTGTAADAIGAARGEPVGPAVRWRYRLEVPAGNSTLVVSMDDWLHRVDEHTVIAHTRMRKFGLPVGDIMAVIRRTEAP
jgi:hypothetical protein